jgi:hypothetical protein
MTLRPFWRYYGGKWRAAPRYPAPQRDTIVEPFAGAAGYATRYHDRRVVLVDRSPIIAGIWRYLIAAKPAEVLAIPNLPEGGTVDDLPVCQEARWLVGYWLNGGSDHPCKTPSAWAREHGDGVHWVGWSDKARNRIASQVEAIRHWRIIEGDYTDAPDVDATWFVDPPYQTSAGRRYREQPDDFDALGAWTLARRGQVIACDQVGADWLPWSGDIEVKGTSGARRAGTSAEVVYHRPAPFRLTQT